MFHVITCYSPHTFKRPILPQISQIYADETQKPKTTLTSPICLSLRDNAACCIPLRHLRYLRENIHPNLLNLYTQTKPQCLPLISQIYADKQQNSLYLKQTVFLCEIMQPRCIRLRDLRYLRENKHVRVLNRNPNVSRRSRRFTQTKPQNSKTATTATTSNNQSFSAK